MELEPPEGSLVCFGLVEIVDAVSAVKSDTADSVGGGTSRSASVYIRSDRMGLTYFEFDRDTLCFPGCKTIVSII